MPNLLLQCAVRAVLIAFGTAVVLSLFRVRRASARHAAWAAVVVWMLLLPIWTLWLPKAPLPVLPATRLPAVTNVAVSSIPSSDASDSPSFPAATPALKWNWSATLLSIYACGAALLLLRLCLGAARARALRRTAPLHQGHYTSPACAAPVTVGCFRPVVILPSGWPAWPPSQLAAVLAHENEHARRRDPLLQFLALLNRAIFWFHPLAWWLERRVSALAEEACDEAALAAGHDPYDYSRYLLQIARDVERSGLRVDVLGMAMPGSSLPRRIRQILSRRSVQRMSFARGISAAAACLLLSSAFAAASLVRQKPRVLAAIRETAAPAPQHTTGRLIALYFDLAVLDRDDQLRAVSFARKYVDTQVQPEDRVSVMAGDTAIHVLQDFTADRDALQQALDRVPNGNSVQQEPARVLDGLLTAVNLLGHMKEKKALVYVARTFPPAASQNLKPLIEAAQKANVAFFPVDTSGAAKQQEPPPAPPAAPEFEVASVKQSAPAAGGRSGGAGAGPRGIGFPDPTHFSAANANLHRLIEFAYDLRDFQVTGPDWLSSQRYDIEAKTSAPATEPQRRQMLQTLLAERLHLVLHRETKELPVFEMTAASGGTKMPAIQPDEPPPPKEQVHHFLYMLATTTMFADVLSHFAGTELPIVDKTGLTGKYRFVIDMEPDQDIVAAVREQLGLKLTARKAPVEILVIDHAEKIPVEN